MQALAARYWEHYDLTAAKGDGGAAGEELWDDVEAVNAAARENAPEAVSLLVAVAEAAPDNVALAYLGAGPVEELLIGHAEDVVEAVDLAAQGSERFRYALRCAWFDDEVPAEVAERLRRFGPSP